MTPDPFFGWPGVRILARALLLGAIVSICWLVLYGGADYLTDWLPYRVRLHLDAELDIPFVPESVLVYMSIYLLFAAAPFILRRPVELDALAATFVVVILVAAVCFLVFPADSYFCTPTAMGRWEGLVHFAKWLARPHNFAPSLHVGLAVCCVTIYARRAPGWGKVVLWLWALAIALSTLVLHQHHVIDVVTGWLLGWAGVRVVFDHWRAGRKDPASPSMNPVPPA
jgi:membrane-associated phospholipid phosphatase